MTPKRDPCLVGIPKLQNRSLPHLGSFQAVQAQMSPYSSETHSSDLQLMEYHTVIHSTRTKNYSSALKTESRSVLLFTSNFSCHLVKDYVSV